MENFRGFTKCHGSIQRVTCHICLARTVYQLKIGFCVLAEPWPGRTLCLGNRYFMGIMASRTLADPYFTDLGIMASRPLFNLAEPPL